jgi:hypothetical protein
MDVSSGDPDCMLDTGATQSSEICKATPNHVAHPYGKESIQFYKILGRETRNLQLMPQEVGGKVLIKVSVVERAAAAFQTLVNGKNGLVINMPPNLQKIEILEKIRVDICGCACRPIGRPMELFTTT